MLLLDLLLRGGVEELDVFIVQHALLHAEVEQADHQDLEDLNQMLLLLLVFNFFDFLKEVSEELHDVLLL